MKNVLSFEKIKQELVATIDEMREDIIRLASDMVKIPSVNPNYDGVVKEEVIGGEKNVQEFLKPIFEEICDEVDMWEVEAQRPNLVGMIKGAGNGKSLIFNGHIDVVPPGPNTDWKFEDPFSGRVEDGKLYGRGACDMKGGIAAQIMAAKALKKLGIQLKGDLLLETVVGEETMDHELGVTATVERGYKADAAIVSEPSGPPQSLAVVPVSPGVIRMHITVKGKTTHASVRREFIRAGGKHGEVGINAVEKGMYIVQALQQLEEEWGFTKTHDLFEPGHFSIHPGIIHGKSYDVDLPFVVSDYCTIQYAVWHHPLESFEEVKAEILAHVDRAVQNDLWLRNHPPEIEFLLHWPAFNVPTDHPIVQATSRAHEEATGEEAVIHGFAAVADAAFLNAKGIPSIIYGPGSILVAHAANEYVLVEDLIKATKTYALTALEWCDMEEMQ
ncbi:ArgE/DapE family deacylase [Lysinibacillus sp. FSL H8-0500]|uniref:ArgE/DapE family deacylase n=1 Tax=Lysinibacillus sp. FSL H8-0500 TaxID=2921393 RepID=UPI0031010B01